MQTAYTGYLSCFCLVRKANGINDDFTYAMADGSEIAICEEYFHFESLLNTITESITLFVVFVN